ncbi:MAG TPA: valine--tRNA ligase [Gaiellales bacterium]|nr:valine--tRNA ligase [Gaiellales bacterium]
MDDARRDELERRTRHQPEAVEARLFERWERECGFSGDPKSDRERFVIPLPPPNVTGELHMGHALNGTIQDTLMRLRRMQGYDTLWICGTDHASIAVHAVIEKQLRAEGTNRFELGREEFVRRVWEWRRATGATIIQQFKRLGCTLDYDHERFTMDEGYVRSVLEMFVRLYGKGLIYRDNRIVNWCPGCRSTVSDLEVRHEHAADALYEVRYRIAGTEDFLTVATVRPETILADTAVAVHPDDDRYTHLVGRTVIVPIVGRQVPIIADEYVKTDFGTGALKITPGHDPNDFEIGRRHGLEELSVIGFDGRMNDAAGEFAGLPVAEARQRVIDRLFDEQLLAGEQPYEHEVGHCDRSGDRIEPLISLQWFMEMQSLAEAANAEVRAGRARFIPKNQENIYFHWMDNIRPWCVSRQLWWGHQIPVWYCPDGHQTVATETPDACAECGSTELERDQDVLDTWFSSALWPFATLGWPEPTERLAVYYPSKVLVTARDIINLWVARMLMMGLEFMGERPFSDIYITSIIQAADGRRMSKSLGTGVNPLELIDRYGADGTRYGLLKMSSTQDVRFAEGMIDEGGKLANKLWNASRFVLLKADPDAASSPEQATMEDRWILSRLACTTEEVLRLLDGYEFAAAVKALYAFIWNDFCDWYVEATKPRLYGEDAAARRSVSSTLLWVLERTLALAHPVMPFVTEEIWGFLPGDRAMLLASPMPQPEPGQCDRELDERARADMEVVSEARYLAGRGTTPQVIAAPGLLFRDLLDRIPGVVITDDEDAAVSSVVAAEDRASLEAKRAEAIAERDRARAKLANEGFTSRAPAQLVEAEREKAERYAAEVSELERRLGGS